MMQLLRKLGNDLKAGIITGAIVATAVLLPAVVSAQAASAIRFDGNLGVANVTNGDTEYKAAINAAQGQTVKIQVYYVNNEAADSNKTSQNVRLKITMPTAAGKAQTVSSLAKGDNTGPVNKQVSINTDRDDAVMQYIPGTAVWKHNTGSPNAQKIEETKLSDDVVNGAQGVVLETQKPGEAYGGTVSVLAKVSVPGGVVVSSQSQLKGQTGQWSANNSAKPADTMRYLISYQNSGSGQQRGVLVRTKLPDRARIVPGTTVLTNAANPSGAKFDSDNVTTTGIIIGNYAAGANAFVSFEVTLPAAGQLTCGGNELRNVTMVKPEGLAEYYGSSVTMVNRDCAAAPVVPTAPNVQTAPTPAPAPAAPATPPSATAPAALPDTGAGEVFSLFAVVAVTGAIGHRLFLARRLS